MKLISKTLCVVALLVSCGGGEGEPGSKPDPLEVDACADSRSTQADVTVASTGGAPGAGGAGGVPQMIGGTSGLGGAGGQPMSTGGQGGQGGMRAGGAGGVRAGGAGGVTPVDTSINNAANWATCKDASDPTFKADLFPPLTNNRPNIYYLFTPTAPRLRCVHCYRPIPGRIPAVSEQYDGCAAFLGGGKLKVACVNTVTGGEPCEYRRSPN